MYKVKRKFCFLNDPGLEKMILVISTALTLCSVAVTVCGRWPDPDKDPLVYIANPIEAEMPGHWVPLSIVKVILEKSSTTTHRNFKMNLPVKKPTQPAKKNNTVISKPPSERPAPIPQRDERPRERPPIPQRDERPWKPPLAPETVTHSWGPPPISLEEESIEERPPFLPLTKSPQTKFTRLTQTNPYSRSPSPSSPSPSSPSPSSPSPSSPSSTSHSTTSPPPTAPSPTAPSPTQPKYIPVSDADNTVNSAINESGGGNSGNANIPVPPESTDDEKEIKETPDENDENDENGQENNDEAVAEDMDKTSEAEKTQEPVKEPSKPKDKPKKPKDGHYNTP